MLPELLEIPKRRRSLGLTQNQLAHLVGVSQSMIAKIEAQSINPSYDKAKRIFDVMEQLERSVETKGKEIATRRIVGVRPQDNVMKAARIMRQAGFSQLPVIDKGRSIGSVSEKSVLAQIIEGQSIADISNKAVLEIMEEAFPLVDEESSLGLLSALLRFSPAVLLTREGKLTGILTKADLLKVVRPKK
jgi:predicted transcriptional regulator